MCVMCCMFSALCSLCSVRAWKRNTGGKKPNMYTISLLCHYRRYCFAVAIIIVVFAADVVVILLLVRACMCAPY